MRLIVVISEFMVLYSTLGDVDVPEEEETMKGIKSNVVIVDNLH